MYTICIFFFKLGDDSHDIFNRGGHLREKTNFNIKSLQSTALEHDERSQEYTQ